VETAEARDPRLLEVSGDPADAVTLRAAGLARAEVLYACAELSATNAATALRAREVSQAQNRPLMAYAQVRDAEICMALRARRIGAADDPRFRLDFFSIEDTAARVLLDEHPLALEGRWPAQVVIVGFGRLGRAVLREIARRPRPDGTPVTVKIRGEAPDSGSDFLDRFPAVRRACSVVWDGIALTGPFGEGPTLVFVCLADNDDALSVGLTAAHSFSTRSGRVVICMGEASPFGAVLTGKAALLDDERGRLAVFGLIEEGCVPRRIREDLHDQLARAIHQAYLDNCRARGDSPSVNKSMRPWEELPDDIKQANLAQAAHLSTKLDAIDCTVIPESAALPGFAFTSAEIELLAHMEHDRWMAERHAQGYTYGPDRVGKQHPDLVDWQYLSESAGEKDRDAVRELPAILRQAGFQILRLPPRTPWAPR
jgi:hypothetical protein